MFQTQLISESDRLFSFCERSIGTIMYVQGVLTTLDLPKLSRFGFHENTFVLRLLICFSQVTMKQAKIKKSLKQFKCQM